MLKHIVKRCGIFTFWLLIISVIIYIKYDYNKAGDIIISLFFPILLLLVFSAIFLIFESTELKSLGKADLSKINKVVGFSILGTLSILLVVFLYSSTQVF